LLTIIDSIDIWNILTTVINIDNVEERE